MHVRIEYAAADFEIAKVFLKGDYDPCIDPDEIEGADYIDDTSLCDPEDNRMFLSSLFDTEKTSNPGIVKLIPKAGGVYGKMVKDAAAANRKIADICEECMTVDPYDALLKLYEKKDEMSGALLRQLKIKSIIEGACGEPVICMMYEETHPLSGSEYVNYITVCGLAPVYRRLSEEEALYAVTGRVGSYHC